MAFGKEKEAKNANDRFECVQIEHFENRQKMQSTVYIDNYIIVDKVTGVNYLYALTGPHNTPTLAITPLLDENGNVIVTK